MDILITAAYIAALLSLAAGLMYAAFKISDLVSKNKKLKEENTKILHQKKSSEVRLGKVAENMAPFFQDWPYDPNNFRFLGNPIDGISFNEDEVVFIEIKSGGARLSKGQKHVRDLVRAGKIKFVSFKVTDTGSEVKLEAETEDND